MEEEVPRRRVTVKRIKRVFDGFLKVDEALFSIERYDGTIAKDVKRLSLERGDSAGALLLDCAPPAVDGNSKLPRVWLVEQFRYSTYEKGPGWILELPTGVIEDGEDPAETVRREVLEEVGVKVQNLEQISTFYVSPGGSSERIFLYFARVDGQEPPQADRHGLSDEGEDIKLSSFPAQDFIKDAKLGNIDDAKTLVAGLWLAANWDRVSRL
jgi:nudix-type nucleoside diphosphatase (YffH/AdpP family)